MTTPPNSPAPVTAPRVPLCLVCGGRPMRITLRTSNEYGLPEFHCTRCGASVTIPNHEALEALAADIAAGIAEAEAEPIRGAN